MSQAVSAAFTAAESAAIVPLAYKVQLVLGDYCTSAFGATATSSGADASNNFPSAGAVNGDRTELNIGAAATADNGVGLASYRSSGIPNDGDTVYLEVDFNATRTFNRVKVYNLDGHGLDTYTIQYWDGAAWQVAATKSGGTSAGRVDTLDMAADISSTKIRIVPTLTAIDDDPANIVELEVYRKVDITARVLRYTVDRQRDWKQVNPMAATCMITCDNSDRFFSMSHTPTAAEVTAGYVNAELRPQVGIIIQEGFYVAAGTALPELVNIFVGFLDTPDADSKAGTCVLTGRDGMKNVINQTLSTKLQYNADNGTLIIYLLNLCNISTWEMSIQLTGIFQPFFFTFNESAFTSIRNLAEASGDAQFWVDENGTPTFAATLFSSGTSQTDFIWNSQALSLFSTVHIGAGYVTNNGNNIVLVTNGAGKDITAITMPSTITTGWQFDAYAPWQGDNRIGVTFMAQDASDYPDGYALGFSSYAPGGNHLNGVTFESWAAGVGTILAGPFYIAPGINHQYTVIRSIDGSGNAHFFVYQDGVLILTVASNTYTTCTNFSTILEGPLVAASASLTISGVFFLNSGYTVSSAVAAGVTTITVLSEAIDQSVNVASEGNLSVGFDPSNAAVTWQTRTSSDGITWGSWTTVTLNSATQIGPITSTVLRYAQYQFYFTTTNNVIYNFYYAIVAWALTAAANTPRAISYLTNLCDIKQQISDSLDGSTSIINQVEVTSAPLALTGTNSDTQWQATSGLQAAPVTTINPMIVEVGTIAIASVVQGGMDVTYMVGTNPEAVAITWGTATGSVAITYIHPTKPIITLTVTGAGTITDLRLIGQALSSAATSIARTAGNNPSQAQYNQRTITINNNWITLPAIAQFVANTQLALYQNPPEVLTGIEICPAPSVQTTDLIAPTDYNLDLSGNYHISGINHEVSAPQQGTDGVAKTTLTALKVV